mmetsp:Transcript_30961/g.77026  ORF Transcript_30961/g.77026 Transcript_30961/m.77026 type:complete len:209 (-) Transcript_30961:562-1188(-)
MVEKNGVSSRCRRSMNREQYMASAGEKTQRGKMHSCSTTCTVLGCSLRSTRKWSFSIMRRLVRAATARSCDSSSFCSVAMRVLRRSFSLRRLVTSAGALSRCSSSASSATRHFSTSASYRALGTCRSYRVRDQNVRYSSGVMHSQVFSGSISRTSASSAPQVSLTGPTSSAIALLHSSTVLSLEGVGRGLRWRSTGRYMWNTTPGSSP